jgi:hypothetical protein
MNQHDMLKVLNQVADGRLSAEEASRVLDGPPTAGPSLIGTLEAAVQEATEAVRSTSERASREQRVDLGGRRLAVRGSGCVLEVLAHSQADVVLQTFGWPARVVEGEREVVIEVMGARTELWVPSAQAVNLTISGSKLSLQNLEGVLALHGVGCDVRVECVAQIHLDAHLDASNLEVSLSSEADPRVTIDCMIGKVGCPEHWSLNKHHGTWSRPGTISKTYLDVRMTAGFLKIVQPEPSRVTTPVELKPDPVGTGAAEVEAAGVEVPETHRSARRQRRSAQPVEAAVLGTDL